MNLLIREIHNTPLLWLLIFVPAVFAGDAVAPDAHTLLFVLSVLAIVPVLSHRSADRNGLCSAPIEIEQSTEA
jgi:hypothetical protein